MNLYEIRFEGHWLGGVAIIAAPDEARALHIAKVEIAQHGLANDNPRVVRQLDHSNQGIIYLDDGDY